MSRLNSAGHWSYDRSPMTAERRVISDGRRDCGRSGRTRIRSATPTKPPPLPAMADPREPHEPSDEPPAPSPIPLSGEARGRRGRRFLFFSNELIGLGHLRRTLSIANRLAQIETE